MKNVHSISVLLFSLFISTSCHFQKGESNENNSSTNQLSLSMNNKMLQADTVKLSISNGSLSPDFQYYQEYILTANEAIFKNQKGENPEVTTRKKRIKTFGKIFAFSHPTKIIVITHRIQMAQKKFF